MKIQYLSTNFVRKLRIQNKDMLCGGTISDTFESHQQYAGDQALLQYFNHDLVLLPFFFDSLSATARESQANQNHNHTYERDPDTGEMIT